MAPSAFISPNWLRHQSQKQLHMPLHTPAPHLQAANIAGLGGSCEHTLVLVLRELAARLLGWRVKESYINTMWRYNHGFCT